jgi:hypothetical protein
VRPWGTNEAKYTGAFALSRSQDRSIRFAAAAEKGADAAMKRLDTHFIDRSGEAPDIRCNSLCSGSSHEKSQPVVGDMRKRITRRCVSAATGACR